MYTYDITHTYYYRTINFIEKLLPKDSNTNILIMKYWLTNWIYYYYQNKTYHQKYVAIYDVHVWI